MWKRNMNKIKTISLYFVLALILSYTYFNNPIDKRNYEFATFEAVSEALAIGPIVAEHAGISPLEKGYGLGYYHENTGDTTSYWTDTLSLYEGDTGYLTNKDFQDGYALSGKQLAFSANLYTRNTYTPGNEFLFWDGSRVCITAVKEQDFVLYVSVDTQKKLTREANGSLSDIRVFDAEGRELSRGIFSEYPSQIGLQGRIFRKLARIFPYGSAVTWLHLLTAIAMSLVVVSISWQLYKKYGWLMAAVFFAVFWLSPWIVQFARNLYWVEFTWFLPMLFGLWCSNYINNRKRIFIGSVGVFLSVFLKSACGYEYITTVMLGAILFLLADLGMALLVEKDREKFRRVFACLFMVGIAALLGFMLAIVIHASIRGEGNITEGIRSIYMNNFKERAWGGDPSAFPESERASLEASVFEVLQKYFQIDTHLIVGVSGKLFSILIGVSFLLPVCILCYKRKNQKGFRMEAEEVFLLLSAFMTSISWFVLGKAHSFIHTHLNFVMWYFGFIQLLFYVPVRSSIDLGKVLVKKWKNKEVIRGR
ncbi:hypothetical protein BEI60_15340 [Eisenbergiella tayi]|nr:hypothetical protein BEI60_15340 [Eisenbergiella tayi]